MTSKLRCNDRDRANGTSEFFTCLECFTGPCKLSTPTQIAPASDKLIESLERSLTERDISTAYSDHVLSLIARIRQEQARAKQAEEDADLFCDDRERIKERTIFECAQVARTFAQDNETIQPSYNGITNAILALLTNKGEQP